LQIDEPAMTRFPEKVAAFGSGALDRCLEGLTVPTIVHLCYGYPGGDPLQHEYGYPDVLRVLMESRIGGFSLEFARSGFDPKILRICDGRLIMFGCIDPGDSPPEPVDAVTRRVREALNYVEPERLLLAPDCGLMTISRELARAKLGVMVQAAAALRREM
jgi:5-methyltetrahydropteroyltriglutamate--homocysteine methyltransferase